MIYEDQYFRTVEDCRGVIAILTINSRKKKNISSSLLSLFFILIFFLSLSIEEVVESVEFVRIRR